MVVIYRRISGWWHECVWKSDQGLHCLATGGLTGLHAHVSGGVCSGCFASELNCSRSISHKISQHNCQGVCLCLGQGLHNLLFNVIHLCHSEQLPKTLHQPQTRSGPCLPLHLVNADVCSQYCQGLCLSLRQNLASVHHHVHADVCSQYCQGLRLSLRQNLASAHHHVHADVCSLDCQGLCLSPRQNLDSVCHHVNSDVCSKYCQGLCLSLRQDLASAHHHVNADVCSQDCQGLCLSLQQNLASAHHHVNADVCSQDCQGLCLSLRQNLASVCRHAAGQNAQDRAHREAYH